MTSNERRKTVMRVHKTISEVYIRKKEIINIPEHYDKLLTLDKLLENCRELLKRFKKIEKSLK